MDLLCENKGDFKKIFSICNNLLDRNKDLPLPPGKTNQQLADDFNKPFVDKTAKIRSNIQATPVTVTTSMGCDPKTPPLFKEFTLLSESQIIKPILSCPSKSCGSYPMPTSLLKDCLTNVAPLATAVVNTSITGVFPDYLKEAHVKPLLKKANLDPLDKNIAQSNLPFISNLIKRVVVDQLSGHIHTNELVESLQSAYILNHSTETALLKVKADIHKALDYKEVVCLVLLDLSIAFDTVNHKILLNRLGKEIWDHRHCTKMGGILPPPIHPKGGSWGSKYGWARSNSVTLTFWVPQGSILGAILFTLYTMLLGDICRKHGITYHLYNDDQKIYLSFKPAKTGKKDDCLD